MRIRPFSSVPRALPRSLPLLSLALPLALIAGGCTSPRTEAFASPELAIDALVESADDPARAESVLGPGGFELLTCGDEVEDGADVATVRALVSERIELADAGPGRKVALLGEERWELPFPLVHEAEGWRFDLEEGRDEVRCRCIGRNELLAIATLQAIVDAQHEFFERERNGAAGEFAQRWSSSPGRHDGLYWPDAEGEPQSPIGPLLAPSGEEAARQDATLSASYHGYRYRILKEKGEHASGGARSYVDANGRMTGGFAIVAWPEDYGETGVMTFQVDRSGIVFEKDLGDDTEKDASRITSFDPDATWQPTAGP